MHGLTNCTCIHTLTYTLLFSHFSHFTHLPLSTYTHSAYLSPSWCSTLEESSSYQWSLFRCQEISNSFLWEMWRQNMGSWSSRLSLWIVQDDSPQEMLLLSEDWWSVQGTPSKCTHTWCMHAHTVCMYTHMMHTNICTIYTWLHIYRSGLLLCPSPIVKRVQ